MQIEITYFLFWTLIIYCLGILSRYLFNRLDPFFELLRSWGDYLFVLFSFVAIVFLFVFKVVSWPLESDDIQLLIFVITFLTLFYQSVIGENPDKHRNRPVIGVGFDINRADNYHKTLSITSWELDKYSKSRSLMGEVSTYYVGLNIINKGKTSLKNVEVVLQKVESTNEIKRPVLPLSLYWSFAGTNINIPPYGMSRIVNVVEFYNPLKISEQLAEFVVEGGGPYKTRYEALMEGFRVCTLSPNTLSDIFPFGEYIFHIVVSADNAEPYFLKLKIVAMCGWEESTSIEDMRKKYLIVELLDNH